MDRPDSTRGQRNRSRIAQTTARLIAEHGLTDWNAAKRKACRELGLPHRETLPDNDEVEQALRDYNSLFQCTEQRARLRLQRLEALRWMERLLQWNPVLTGAVAAGWATEYSEVRLELEAEDAKSVELSLLNAGVEYACAPASGGSTPQVQLRIERPEATLRLVIVSPLERRNRRRRGRNGDADDRLGVAQLKALLDAEGEA
ncbi:MAG TPA: hypothetical protein VLQ46_06530 [Casimicrobiaceae bacterium]|nr:hypothetical protein [Casimicrobiaceae bacterium]